MKLYIFRILYDAKSITHIGNRMHVSSFWLYELNCSVLGNIRNGEMFIIQVDE
jgi:hypothetical protein